MKRNIMVRIIAWALVFVLLMGMTASAVEDMSAPTVEDVSQPVTFESLNVIVGEGELVSEGTDLLEYLKTADEDGGPVKHVFTFSFADGREVPTDDAGNYILEKGEEYTLRFTTDEIKTLEAGKYYLKFPEGLTGIKGGNLTGLNVGGKWSYDPDTGYVIFEIEDEDSYVSIDATFTFTLTVTSDKLDFGDLSVTVKQPEPEGEPDIDKTKYGTIYGPGGDYASGVNGDALALLDPNKELSNVDNIVWLIVLDYPGALIDKTLIDARGTENWTYTAADQARGVVVELIVDGEPHYAKVDVQWTGGNPVTGWEYTLVSPIQISATEWIDLKDVSKMTFFFAGTIDRTDTDESVSEDYKNCSNIPGFKGDDTTLTRNFGDLGVGDASKSFAYDSNWGPNQEFAYNVRATIPDWNGSFTPYGPSRNWTIEDKITLRLENTVVVPVYNLLAEKKRVTATAAGQPIPYIDDASGSASEFAWGITAVDQAQGSVTIKLYNKCDCKDLMEDDIPDGHEEINGYCNYWTKTGSKGGTTTFSFAYTYTHEDIKKYVYTDEAAGQIAKGDIDRIHNIETLYLDGKPADSSSKYGKFPTSSEKKISLDKESENILEYDIKINEGHIDYGTNAPNIVITDKMSVGLSLLENEELRVEADGVPLVQGRDYTIEYYLGRENEPIFTILHPTGNAMYTLHYQVSISEPDLVDINYVNEADIEMFGVTLEKKVSNRSKYDVSATSYRYEMEVTKLRADSGKPLAGAEYEFGENGQRIASFVTDGNGKISITPDTIGMLLYRHRAYYVQETKAPDGFALDGARHWFIFCRDGNSDCQSCAKIVKTIEGLDGQNADYEIYVAEKASMELTDRLATAYTPKVTKALTGSTPATSETFRFTLVPASGNKESGYTLPANPMTATVTGKGTATFGEIKFNEAGTYIFEIREEKGDAQYYTYDTAVWTLTVTVSEGTDRLVASASYAQQSGGQTSSDSATFTNAYVTPTPEATETPEPTETPTPVPTAAPTPTPTPEPELIDITGNKTWNDNDDELGLRPESVTVRLMRNGETIATTTASAATGWTYSFTGLPADDGRGNAYTYTVSEQMVSGYFSRVNGYDLVNELIPTTTLLRNDDGTIIREYGVPLGALTEMELEDLIDLFDYGTPLFGLLGTGDDIPAYPFVFGGIGIAALIALAVAGRRKRRGQAA